MATSEDFERLRRRARKLEQVLGAIAREAADGAELAEKNPNLAAAAARRVTEGLLKDVIARRDRKTGLSGLSGLTIEQLKGKLEKGDLPKAELPYVDIVQKLGNAGAHHAEEGLTPRHAYTALDAALHLLTWYAKRHHPRRRAPVRWSLVFGGAALAGVAFVAGGAAITWLTVSEPAAQVVTVPAPAASAPTVGASVAAPVGAPVAAVAPVEVSTVPLWSRPLLSFERPGESPHPAAARVCEAGMLTGVTTVRTVGSWVAMTGTCDGAPVEGWAAVSTVPGAAQGAVNRTPFGRAATVHLYEAGVAAGLGDWAEAQRRYDTVIEDLWSDPHPYEGRAAARLGAGDGAGALADAALCLTLDPNRGKCLYHAAVAYKLLGDSEWDQILSDAVARDASLASAAAELRGLGQQAVHYVQDFGREGLPVYERRLAPAALERPSKRVARWEVCRLQKGAAVEVLPSEPDPTWHHVRVTCGGRKQEGWIVMEHKHKPTLAAK